MLSNTLSSKYRTHGNIKHVDGAQLYKHKIIEHNSIAFLRKIIVIWDYKTLRSLWHTTLLVGSKD